MALAGCAYAQGGRRYSDCERPDPPAGEALPYNHWESLTLHVEYAATWADGGTFGFPST
jgi:hypothetical protein